MIGRGAPRTPGSLPRVAVVHDYFTQRGGAELVAARMASRFEGARTYASLVDVDVLPEPLASRGVRTSLLQPLRRAGVPLAAFAPVLPGAFGAMRLGDAEVVVSSSAAFAHHVRPPRGAAHICYCHTPPRFLWQVDEYFRGRSLLRTLGSGPLALLRQWDASAARRADVYVANSMFTAERIRRTYGREPIVVYPPIEVDRFEPTTARSGRFLIVARLRPHKRIDLAIGAADALRAPLDIIGEGSDLPRLQALAGPTVRFLGRRSDAEVRQAMARCAGLVTPGIEDFGMTTAEVQAAGRPPIAFAAGGSNEIVVDGETGFLFDEPSTESLAEAMRRAHAEPLDPMALRASAARFDAGIFDASMLALVRAAASNPIAHRAAGAARLEPAAVGSAPEWAAAAAHLAAGAARREPVR